MIHASAAQARVCHHHPPTPRPVSFSFTQSVALPRHDIFESRDETHAEPLHVVLAVHVRRCGAQPLRESRPRLLPRPWWSRFHEPGLHPRHGRLVKKDIRNVRRLATRVLAREGAQPAVLQRRLHHTHAVRYSMRGAMYSIGITHRGSTWILPPSKPSRPATRRQCPVCRSLCPCR